MPTAGRPWLLSDLPVVYTGAVIGRRGRPRRPRPTPAPDEERHGIELERLEHVIERAVLLEARDEIGQALERTGGNRTRAAQLLGLSRDQLRYRIDKLLIADPS